jgi:gas vesicle protein
MENNSGSSMFPFISGVVIGAVLGILFAPDKGSETRKKVMNTIGDLSDITGIGSQEDEYEGSSYNTGSSHRTSGSMAGSSQGSSSYSGSTSGNRSH